MEGYGDCANNDEAVACLDDEICVIDTVLEGNAVCIEQNCVTDADCALPATGDATPTCADVTNDMVTDCYLSCQAGETCPDGMFCVAGFVCIWDLQSECPDQDLGSAVPQSVMGDNTGLGNDHVSSCGDGGGQDATYQFTAMVAGTYVFSTEGSMIDTILSVLDGCGGLELDCNDDTVGLTSEVTIDLAAGQSVILVVDGFDGEMGPITVSVSQ